MIYLPYEDFNSVAQVLGDAQIEEGERHCLKVIKALEKVPPPQHPEVKMWAGYELALGLYGLTICHEARDRGSSSDCLLQVQDRCGEFDNELLPEDYPAWLGCLDVHVSHQSRLLRLDPGRYEAIFPNVPNDLEVVWLGGTTVGTGSTGDGPRSSSCGGRWARTRTE